jgi:HEAT repeat protein
VSIVPKLLNFLKADDTWSVRLEAAESLTQMMNILPKIEVIDVLKFLSELNADKNRYVRWGIIKLFSSIALAREDKISEITPFLLNGLTDEEWSVRKGTVESFNRLIDNFPDIIPIVVGKSLALLNDEDTDIIKELFTLFRKVTGTDVNSDTLQIVGSQIAEKAGPQYKLDSNLFESALKKVKEATKPAKFVFKKSDLPEK